MMYRGTCRWTSSTLVVLLFSTPVLARLIDDFEQGTAAVDFLPDTPAIGYINQSSLDPQHTLLGFRGVFLDAPTTSGTTATLAPSASQDDAIVMQIPAGEQGVLGLAYLDALASAPEPQMGDLDLTSDGANAFAVTVTTAPETFSFDAFLSTDPLGEHRGTINLTGSGPGTYFLKFEDVRPYTGETTPDFSDVDYLSFHFFARAGATPVTLAISEISTVIVPEPGITGAALLCLGGMVCRRRPARN